MEQASDVVELVLPHEVDNPNNVYLYLEGDAWCAYERSAYYLTQMEVSVVLKKEVIHDDYDVVLLKAFFAVNDMYLPLSPTAVLKLVADDKLQFQIRDRVEGFSDGNVDQQMRNAHGDFICQNGSELDGIKDCDAVAVYSDKSETCIEFAFGGSGTARVGDDKDVIAFFFISASDALFDMPKRS